MSDVDELIEDYLDDLLRGLRGRPRDIRRMLAETEDHLRTAVSVEELAGMTSSDATRAAFGRFGSAAEVIQAWNVNPPVESLRRFVGRLSNQLLPLVGVGLVAVGLSGVAARVMTALWGPTFMYADPAGTTYPAAACRHWMSLHPAAGTCANAYLAESQADGLLARYAAGLLGLILLATIALIRRSRHPAADIARPPMLTSFTATVMFSLAALGLVALGIDSIRMSDSHGAGQWLSGAVIALPLGCAYGYRFLVTGRRSTQLL